MRVNAYFGPRRTNIPHATPNYGPGKSRFGIDYYKKMYFFHKTISYIGVKLEK